MDRQMYVKGHPIEELPPAGLPPYTQHKYGVVVALPSEKENLESWTFNNLDEVEANVAAIESSYSDELSKGASIAITHWMSGDAYWSNPEE